MSTAPTGVQGITEADIANYLATSPGFFERHAELLASVQLANPHGQRAVSLQERQNLEVRRISRIVGRDGRLTERLDEGHDHADPALPGGGRSQHAGEEARPDAIVGHEGEDLLELVDDDEQLRPRLGQHGDGGCLEAPLRLEAGPEVPRHGALGGQHRRQHRVQHVHSGHRGRGAQPLGQRHRRVVPGHRLAQRHHPGGEPVRRPPDLPGCLPPLHPVAPRMHQVPLHQASPSPRRIERTHVRGVKGVDRAPAWPDRQRLPA